MEAVVEQALAENTQAVVDFRKGKEQALKFMVGQVMSATGGRANPSVVNGLLKKKLEEGQTVAWRYDTA